MSITVSEAPYHSSEAAQRAPEAPADSGRGFADLAALACDRAVAFREALATSPPRPLGTVEELRASFDIGLPDRGREGMEVIERLAAAAAPGLVGNGGPDFYGWVMGASHPVGIAADWLTAAWGQNAAIYGTSPAAAIAEEVAARWLLDLLRLPPESSVGFTTGATMASFICLAAARGEVLRRAGYDCDEGGMFDAPPVTVFIGEEAHATVFSALRYLGFGRRNLVPIPTDDDGRMKVDALASRLEATSGPRIIVGQCGQINTGAFDPIPAISELAREHGAWLHIDGAFGLWARAVPEFADLSTGTELADSWAVDGHKWLQVPYDSGFAIVRDEHAHKRAMDTTASYLNDRPEDGRNPTQYGPELSRRARGFAVWAVLQALGRKGVAELVRRHCRLARELRDRLRQQPGIFVLNEVHLNQLAIGFGSARNGANADEITERTIAATRDESTCFVEGATWKGRRIMRVSVISAETHEEHVERLAHTIIRAWRRVEAVEAP